MLTSECASQEPTFSVFERQRSESTVMSLRHCALHSAGRMGWDGTYTCKPQPQGSNGRRHVHTVLPSQSSIGAAAGLRTRVSERALRFPAHPRQDSVLRTQDSGVASERTRLESRGTAANLVVGRDWDAAVACEPRRPRLGIGLGLGWIPGEHSDPSACIMHSCRVLT